MSYCNSATSELVLLHRPKHNLDPPLTQVLLSQMRQKTSSFLHSHKTLGAFRNSTDVHHHITSQMLSYSFLEMVHIKDAHNLCLQSIFLPCTLTVDLNLADNLEATQKWCAWKSRRADPGCSIRLGSSITQLCQTCNTVLD